MTESVSTRSTRSEHERDLLSRLYREIGISAVAAALEVQVGAVKTRRISAQNLLDKRSPESRAA